MPAACAALCRASAHSVDRGRRFSAHIGNPEATTDTQLFQVHLGEKGDQQRQSPLEALQGEDREPMCACTPTRRAPLVGCRSLSTASAAAPDASPKPNFESSWPVITYSWVWASIPGVTRTRTFGSGPPGRDARTTRPGGLSRRTSRRRSCPRPAVQCRLQLGLRLVVTVQHQPLCGHPSGQRYGQLPARRYVYAAAFLVGQRGHRFTQEGLGGVGGSWSECLACLLGTAGAGAPRRRRTPGSRPRRRDPGGPHRRCGAGRRPRPPPCRVTGTPAARPARLRRASPGQGRPRRADGRAGEGVLDHVAPMVVVGKRQRMLSWPAPVAQGIEHRPPEPGAQVRILSGAPGMERLA